MSEAIVMNIVTDQGLIEVIGVRFKIEGYGDEFAVHAMNQTERAVTQLNYAATHIKTGMSFMNGLTVEETMRLARSKWLTKTPAQISAILSNGMEKRKAYLKGLK